ncbi:hypothetical protein, partial [Ralstonia pseudosolanacearum]
ELLTPHLATQASGVRVHISYAANGACCKAVLGEQWQVTPSDEVLASFRSALSNENVYMIYG